MPFSMSFSHETNKKLSDLSTFGIGGPARFFAKAHTIDQMILMLKQAYENELSVLIVGKGSNSLFDDRGFDGLVILNKIEHVVWEGSQVCVGSGYSFPRLGAASARKGFAGLEFAAGIPATVGGAIYMNAGANGKQSCNALCSVSFVNQTGDLQTFSRDELAFGYRSSSFQKMDGAIVEATFELKVDKEAKAWQQQIVEYRMKTQPYGMKSAGCAFRNPEGDSAGRLIEVCGLKGMRVGGVSISNMHANFIVNDRSGSSADVLQLIKQVQDHVYREKGISLEVEIRYIPPHV